MDSSNRGAAPALPIRRLRQPCDREPGVLTSRTRPRQKPQCSRRNRLATPPGRAARMWSSSWKNGAPINRRRCVSFRLPQAFQCTLVARGEVELGFQQLSELLHVPGIDVVGALPREIQSLTRFSCGVCVLASNEAGARGFISYLTSAEADASIRRHGMEPAHPTS